MRFSLRSGIAVLAAATTLTLGTFSIAAWPVHAAPHVQAPERMAQITVTGTDFSRVPSQLNAGLVRLNLITPGSNANAQIAVARLSKPSARAKVAAGMARGINAVFPFITLEGGVGAMPHQPQTAIFNLTPGTYVVFDLNGLTANKNPHSPYHFLTVTGQLSTATPPAAATVRALDFKFQTSGRFAPGYTTLQLVNTGHEPHELDLMKIAPGKTLQDVKMAMMGNSQPKWAQEVGSWGAISPGHRQWLRVQLTPGNYVMMCWIPDQFSYPGHKATNKPHVMLGMIKMISVH